MVKGLSSGWGPCFRTVLLHGDPRALSCWENIIAAGCTNSNIFTIDAITGSQMAVLSGHREWVLCVIFSSDGRSLASGSEDTTVKLWDMQTGGVIKTFHGHNHGVCSVSISEDCTGVVSGSRDSTVCLWDIQTGVCLHTIKQQSAVEYVIFSPTNPQHILLISDWKVWEWDINSQQTSSLYKATFIAFSADNTQLALSHHGVITVQNFNSGAIVAQLDANDWTIKHCCFSPDNKLIAAAAGNTVYVWDVASLDCCLTETFVGPYHHIPALVFSSPSSLISASSECLLKFWKVGALSQNQAATDLESAPLTLSPIQSVSLQERAGVAISSDEDGVVKTWDLSTGLCKTSHQTPVSGWHKRDVQLIGSRLVIVWYDNSQIHNWDINKNEPLWTVDGPSIHLEGLRISGDGTKVFSLTETSIQAWSMETGEHVGKMEMDLEGEWYLDPLQMAGSRIWIRLKDLSTQGWDFGTSSSPPTPRSARSMGMPLLDFIRHPCLGTVLSPLIWDTISGKEVFQLSGTYKDPGKVQWDGRYLIASYNYGKILILDFCCMHP